MPDDSIPEDDNDAALLGRFHRTGDEEAFATLVHRWLPMMEGCARRVCSDVGLARDAVQSVFCVLARKAGRLSPGHATLGGWLHRAVTLECRNLLRRDRSRQRAVQRFANETLTAMNATAGDRWNDALPHLDAAINDLPAADRELIVQRFFERRSWQEIGASRGRSPDAARMALGTALEKLARSLRARGVAVAAAVLATGLGGLAPGSSAAAEQVAGIVRAAVPFRAAGSGFAVGSWTAAAAGFVIAAPLAWLAARSPALAQPDPAQSPPSVSAISQTGSSSPASTNKQPFDLAALLSDLNGLAPSGNDPEHIARLRAILIDLPPSAVPDVFAALKTRKWHTDTRLVAEAFFARWAELDATAAFEGSKDKAITGAAKTALITLVESPGLPAEIAVRCMARLHGWTSPETQKAFENNLASQDWQGLAGRLTKPEERRFFTAAVLNFADLKQPQTVNLLMPAVLADRQLIRTFAAKWAEANEPAALAWLETRPHGTVQYHEPALAIANVIARRDPALAAQMIREVPLSERYQIRYITIWNAWMKTDRAAADAALKADHLSPKAMELLLKALK